MPLSHYMGLGVKSCPPSQPVFLPDFDLETGKNKKIFFADTPLSDSPPAPNTSHREPAAADPVRRSHAGRAPISCAPYFCVDRFLRSLRLQPSHFRLLATLVAYANKHGQAWPGVPTLAEDCGCSPRHIVRLTADLEKMGLIIRLTVRGGEDGGSSTSYDLAPLQARFAKYEDDRTPASPRDDKNEMANRKATGHRSPVTKDSKDVCKTTPKNNVGETETGSSTGVLSSEKSRERQGPLSTDSDDVKEAARLLEGIKFTPADIWEYARKHGLERIRAVIASATAKHPMLTSLAGWVRRALEKGWKLAKKIAATVPAPSMPANKPAPRIVSPKPQITPEPGPEDSSIKDEVFRRVRAALRAASAAPPRPAPPRPTVAAQAVVPPALAEQPAPAGNVPEEPVASDQEYAVCCAVMTRLDARYTPEQQDALLASGEWRAIRAREYAQVIADGVLAMTG